MPVLLAPFATADVPDVCALERRCFSDPWQEVDFAVLPALPYAHALTARDETGALLGYAVLYLIADEAELLNLAVAPEARRTGIAAAMLSRLLAKTEAAGAAACYLEVRESNLPAQALYRRFGFAEVGRRARYYANPTEDALLMALPLPRSERTLSHADSQL